jgi:predicted negative regulator of RcsB-dependent stress response
MWRNKFLSRCKVLELAAGCVAGVDEQVQDGAEHVLHRTTAAGQNKRLAKIIRENLSKVLCSLEKKIADKTHLKEIVSRDWGRLQTVLLDRYRVLDITAWVFFLKSFTYF